MGWPRVDEPCEQPVDFGLALTIHEQRNRRREGKTVFDRAVDGHEGLALNGKTRLFHRPLRARLARAVAADGGDGGIGKQRDVEVERLFAAALEHQEGFDFLLHDSLDTSWAKTHIASSPSLSSES